MNSKIFKAYDIRGKYPDEINEETASKIISSFISKLKVKKSRFKIVVAHDARLSSPALYRAVLDSLKTDKLKTALIGPSTTPMFYFLVNKLKADIGIMITASHNPKNYNGLKVVGKNAIPISGYELHKFIH